MRLFALEHTKAESIADFALYGMAVVVLAGFLLIAGPRDVLLEMAGFVVLGLCVWTLVEYALHRFVLHGLQPFRRWHTAHHQHPLALIFTPTILSASLLTGLVFLPALAIGGTWRGGALTLGMLVGYLAYSVTHYSTHHWRSDNAWLKQRKRWHALHHHVDQRGYYGVTSSFWDYVFGSTHGAGGLSGRKS